VILRREHAGLAPHCNVTEQRDLSTLKNQSIWRTDLGSLGDASACAAPHRSTSRGRGKALIFLTMYHGPETNTVAVIDKKGWQIQSFLKTLK
jgi:hypothetical protein